MGCARSGRGVDPQLLAHGSRGFCSTAEIGSQAVDTSDLFLAHGSSAVFAGPSRALDFRVWFSVVSSPAIFGDRVRRNRGSDFGPLEVPHLRGTRDRVHLHACPWIARLGAHFSGSLDFTTPPALAIMAGAVACCGGDLRRGLFFGLRKAGLFAAICAEGFASQIRALHPRI